MVFAPRVFATRRCTFPRRLRLCRKRAGGSSSRNFHLFRRPCAIRTQRDELHTKPMDTRHMEPFIPFSLLPHPALAAAVHRRYSAGPRVLPPQNRLVQGDVERQDDGRGGGVLLRDPERPSGGLYGADRNPRRAACGVSSKALFSAWDLRSSDDGLFDCHAEAAAKSGNCRRQRPTHRRYARAHHAGRAFHDLALVVCDEQHRSVWRREPRFLPRAKRRTFSSCRPHPSRGRSRSSPTGTWTFPSSESFRPVAPGRYLPDREDKRQRLNALLKNSVEARHQVYIVCPTVEESDLDSLKSAESFAQTLRQVVFPPPACRPSARQNEAGGQRCGAWHVLAWRDGHSCRDHGRGGRRGRAERDADGN